MSRLNVSNPIVYADGTMTPHFRDFMLRLDRLMARSEGWKDEFAALVAAATGAGSPDMFAFGPTGNIKQRRFKVGDSVYVCWHVNHDVKVGSTCYMHVHWSTDGTDTNTVKWDINYTFAKGHNQEAYPAETTVSVEEAGSGTAWQHMISEDTVGMTIPEVDSLIIAEVERVTNGGTNNTDDVFGLYVDIHYESDRDATPNRAPDFYT